MLTPMELYSEYIFTTLKKESGEILDLNEHIGRLKKQACEYYFVENIDDLVSGILKDLKEIKDDHIRIRVNIFAKKRDELLFREMTCEDLSYSISQKKITGERDSAKARISIGQNSSELENFKIANYAGSFYLRRKAFRDGYNEVVFKTSDNEILEASTSNLVFKLEGKWITPKRFIYKGLSRQKLLDACKIEEVIMYEQDLKNCSDAYLINSVEGFVPLSNIDNYNFENKNLMEIQGE